MVGQYLRAMVGLRRDPDGRDNLALALIDNGSTETMAMGAWAGVAVSEGSKLAARRRPGGAYARIVVRLTVPTLWVLVPQVLLGVGLAVLVTSLALSAT